jgi:hypothetical protein
MAPPFLICLTPLVPLHMFFCFSELGSQCWSVFHRGVTGKSTSKVSVYLLTFGGSLLENKIKSLGVESQPANFWLRCYSFAQHLFKFQFLGAAVMVHRAGVRKYKYTYWHTTSKTWSVFRRGYPTVCHHNQDQAVLLAAKAWKVARSTFTAIVRPDAAQEERKYKYLFWHTTSKTWQTVRRGFESVTHTDQEKAAKLMAKLWNISRADLKLDHEEAEPENTVPEQKHKHITWHCNQKVWIAQVSSKYLGCSSDELSAVDMVCKRMQCKRKDVELPSKKRACSTSTDTCTRFAVMMRVFAGVRKLDPPMVPADFAHLMLKAGGKQKDGVIEGGGGIAFPYLVSKFPAHRDAIESSLTLGRGKSAEEKLYNRLVAASKKMSGHNLDKALVRNVGRNNMHHGSFVMFASKGLKLLRIVHGVAKNRAAADACLQFGKAGKYKVKRMDSTLKRKLSVMIGFDKALCSSRPPETIADWRVELDRLQKVMIGPPQMPGCAGKYRGVWAIRCGLIYLMRRAGIKRLDVEGCSVRDLSSRSWQWPAVNTCCIG